MATKETKDVKRKQKYSRDRFLLILLVVTMSLVTIFRLSSFHFTYSRQQEHQADAPVQLHLSQSDSMVFSQTRPEPSPKTNTKRIRLDGSQPNVIKQIPQGRTKVEDSVRLAQGQDPLNKANTTRIRSDGTANMHGSQPNVVKQISQKRTAVNEKVVEQTVAKSNNLSRDQSVNGNMTFDVLALRHAPSPKFPPDFSKTEATIDILSDSSFDLSTLKPLNLQLNTKMLGLLVDAGRHYFSITWLKRLVDVMAILQYNLLHLRLTDDQAFAIQLQSQPALACPTHLHGNNKTYSREELQDLNIYAKSKGIDIVPEINIPGHAGAWAGIEGLVIPCRKQACTKGYALPLNISHPNFRGIITDVLREVIDIFDNPLYLHLGGDEMELATPCFNEVKADIFDYSVFESMLKDILKEIEYPEEQVIRWRETNFAAHTAKNLQHLKAVRAGKINHWWHDTPGKTENVTIGTPIIGSARLYMDVNVDEAAWEVFLHSRKWWHLEDVFPQNAPVILQGIIVGAFELGKEFFFDRNVLGRMLAVTIGVSSLPIANGNDLNLKYGDLCAKARFPGSFCRKYGHPMIGWGPFRRKWSMMWTAYKRDICQRF